MKRPRPRTWMGRLLDAAQRRFSRARPGSVLIMVVALLVLLALIGTAAMSTARMDRISSVQHVANTEIDMLAESVKEMVLSHLVGDLFTAGKPNTTDSPAVDPDNPLADTRDVILGSRLPERLLVPANNTIDQVPQFPIWRSPSYPPIKTGNPYRFDPPNEDSSNTAKYTLPLPKVVLQPTYTTVNGETMPALIALNPDGTPAFNRTGLTPEFLAADADGDGVADAILFKLPVSPIGGITYYAAIRVIDNNSAINLNTAGDPASEIVTVKGVTANVSVDLSGIFPAGINLTNPNLNLILNVNDVQNLYAQRLYGDYKAGPVPPATTSTVGENGTSVRTDFVWLTPGDLLHHQLGRRLDNPGFWEVGRQYGAGVRPFGVDASMTLARRFTIYDPSAKDTLVEKALPKSTVSTPAGNSKPYTAVNTWFGENFDFPPFPTSGPMTYKPPVRALLTSLNPVRNDVTRNRYLYHVTTTPDTDKDKFPTKANLNTASFQELHQNFFDVMCGSATTTPFDDDLGFAFSQAAPYVGMQFVQGGNFASIPQQHPARMFRSTIRGIGFPNVGLGTLHPYQMMTLRAAIAAANVIELREPENGMAGTRKVHGKTISLPLPPNPPTGAVEYKRVHVYGVRKQPFITEVYLNNNPENIPTSKIVAPMTGQERNHRGFAAIELHNPYDEPMDLTGWVLKVIDRTKDNDPMQPNPGLKPYVLGNNSTTTGPLGMPTDLATQETPAFKFDDPAAGGSVIPAGGYMVIWNYKKIPGAPSQTDFDTAQFLPSDIVEPIGANTTVVYLKTLHNIIGKEVVLMRPADDGTDAPVDSFDSSSMAKYEYVAGTLQTSVDAWHYVRANDPASGTQTGTTVTPGRAWNFVYPGRYDATAAGNKRHQGTDSENWNPKPDNDEPWSTATPPAPPIKLGDTDPLNSRERSQQPTYTYNNPPVYPRPAPPLTSSFAIQIANAGMESQFQVGATSKTFPLQGYARTGDLMQATFIGSYAIEVEPVATPPRYVEINALPVDAAFAEDTDVYDDFDTNTGLQMEEIGRFAPLLDELQSRRVSGTVTSASGNDSFVDTLRTEKNDSWVGYDLIVTSSDPAANPKKQYKTVKSSNANGTIQADSDFNPPWPVKPGDTYVLQYSRYGFAKKIYDYFTAINCPADDYLPSKDPNVGYAPAPDPVRNASRNRSANRQGLTPTAPTPPSPTEDNVGVEGLININTANWKVLASLPLVLTSGGGVDPINTERLAKRIVYYRDVDDGLGPIPTGGGPPPPHPHGPFRSIAELLIIPEFQTAEGAIVFNVKGANDPAFFYGDFSLLDNTRTDNVRGDFEEKYLNLTRISNLITTRSDAFTAYVQVQGWRDAGTANARLAVQRRLAFIVDRSSVTKANKLPKVYNVPTAN